MNNVDLCRTLTDECFLLYTLHLINTGSKFNDIGLVMQLHGFSCILYLDQCYTFF